MSDHSEKAAAGFGGVIWFIDFVHPVWWKVLVGLIIWPYDLGAALR